MKAFRRKIVRQGELQMAYASEYIKWVNQGLGAIKETKVTGKEGYFLDRFSEAYIVFGNAYRIFQVFVQTPKLLIESLVISEIERFDFTQMNAKLFAFLDSLTESGQGGA